MYFRYGDGVDGGHNALGAAAPALPLELRRGLHRDGLRPVPDDPQPEARAATLRVTYYLGAGPPVVRSLTAPANARTTVAVFDPALGVGRGQEVSTLVESLNGVGVVVERPIYFRYGPGWTGGHVVVGAPG